MVESRSSEAGAARIFLVIGGLALGGLVLLGALVGGCVSLGLASFRSSEAYQQALRDLRQSEEARQVLGEPIKDGWFPSGTIETSGSSGEATLAIPVKGPKGGGTLHVEAVKNGRRRAGTWP